MDHPKIQMDEQGTLRLNFGEYGKEVETAAISGDGRFVLTNREVGVAQIWDVESGSLAAEIRPDSPLVGKKDSSPTSSKFQVFIESAALNSDGSFALLGLNDGTAVIYEVAGPTLRAVLHPPDEPGGTEFGVIRSVCYGAGDLALVGFPRRCVGVWSTDGSQLIAFLNPHSDQLVRPDWVRDTLVSTVDLSPDGRYVFAGAVDMTAVIFDLVSGEVVFEATHYAEKVITILEGPDRVGWASSAGLVWAQDETGKIEKCLETGDLWAEVMFDPQGESLLARGVDGRIKRWALSGESELLYEPAIDKYINTWPRSAQTLRLDDELIYYPEGGHRVVIRRGDQCATVDGVPHIVTLQLSPQGNMAAVELWHDNQIDLWDLTSERRLRTITSPGGVGSFAFSPDGSLLAVGEIGNGGGLYPRTLYVFETATGELLHQLSGHEWQISGVAFSPDGRRLASLCDDLIVWDLADLSQPVLHEKLERCGEFLFVGDEILTFSKGNVRIFAGNKLRLQFEAPLGFEAPWQVSRDGERLLVSGSQSITTYSLRTGEQIESVAAEIVRPERFPPYAMAVEHEIHGGGGLWRTEFGNFLHQSDGPRGWIEPLRLSQAATALPCSTGAVVVRVGETKVEQLGFVPFAGRLRAGRVVGDESLMVNEQGQLFRAAWQESR